MPVQLNWVLLIVGFVSSAFSLHFVKLLKRQDAHGPGIEVAAGDSSSELRKSTRNRLLIFMVVSSIPGLCIPLWSPLVGTSLGLRGDVIVGLITVAIVCTFFGFKLRRI
jgi:hypothetical protein